MILKHCLSLSLAEDTDSSGLMKISGIRDGNMYLLFIQIKIREFFAWKTPLVAAQERLRT